MIEIAAPEAAPVRLDIFLAHHLPGVGRRAARALVARGAVRLNGRRARKADLVHPNDLVCVAESANAASAYLPPEADLPIVVLHVDDVLVAIDKPPGMPVHGLRPGERGTAANFLVAHYPEVDRVGTNALEAGLVHRLDTGTSGVLLAARSPDAYRHLRRMFRARQVSKLYLAIVVGNIARGGRIATPIAHAPHNRRRMCVCRSPSRARSLKARPAMTFFRPLRRLSGATLLLVKIATGVRHQIRVHLSSIGHPLVGETLYTSASAETITAARPLLHAVRVRLPRAGGGPALTIDAPLPADFKEAIRRLEPL